MQQLTDERRLIKEAAHEFTMKRVLPLANKLDPEKGLIPRELIDELAELGYFAILIPEEYGGLGLGAYEIILVGAPQPQGATIVVKSNIGGESAPTPVQRITQ